MSDFAPVVVFAFNRPRHLERVLEALSRSDNATQTNVIVFADGPRSAADDDGVNEVRGVLSKSVWQTSFSSFETKFSARNQGLAKSILAGVSSVIETEGAAIVLEDDIVVSVDFLTFMNDCIRLYRNNAKVGSISGYCPLQARDVPSNYEHEVLFVPRICSHGWATWKNRWESVDWTAADAPKIWADPNLKRRMNLAGSDQLYRLRRQLTGRIHTWAILFQLWLTLEQRWTVYSRRNLVENIGFDGSGTHTRPGDKIGSDQGADIGRIKVVDADPSDDVIKQFKRVYSGSIPGRVKRFLINLVPPRMTARQPW